MAGEASIKLTGFDVLGNLFDRLPRDIAREVGIAALKKGAKPILEAAQDRVPEGRTGKLADSLAIVKVKADVPTVSIIARRKRGMGGWHAHLVELGTKPHDIKNVFIKGKFFPVIHHPGSRAKPFLRPALIIKKNEALKVMLESISGEVVRKIRRALKNK